MGKLLVDVNVGKQPSPVLMALLPIMVGVHKVIPQKIHLVPASAF